MTRTISMLVLAAFVVVLAPGCGRPSGDATFSTTAREGRPANAAPQTSPAPSAPEGPGAGAQPAVSPESEATARIVASEEKDPEWSPDKVWADDGTGAAKREQAAMDAVSVTGPRMGGGAGKTAGEAAEAGKATSYKSAAPAKPMAASAAQFRAVPTRGESAQMRAGDLDAAGYAGGGGAGMLGTRTVGPYSPTGGLILSYSRPRPRPSRPADRIVRYLPDRPVEWPRNARYRSNYLPGRGYLDGLASLLRRPIPALGDLASLLPARRAPALPVPSGRALDLVVDQQYPLVPPEGIRTTLRVRLRASEGSPRSRPPLRLHLVIDASGSMKGGNWQQVCAAVGDVATRLGPQDLLSVVLYDESAWTVSPAVPGGPAALAIVPKVCGIRPRRETNLFAGLAEGYAQARAVYTPGAVNRVLLLSDGMPTRGPTDLYSLTSATTDALAAGITTSTVGIGDGFDALIMGRIASEGAGNFHFVRDRAGIPAVLTDELHVLAHEAAEAVEVRVRLDPRVRLVEVVGSEPLGVAESLRARAVEVATDQRLAREQGIAPDRARDLDAGIRFLIPSFRLGDEHAFVVTLDVPPDVPPGRMASVELRYKDMLAGRNVYLRADPFVGRARDRVLAEQRMNPDVLVAAARARMAEALQRASEYMDSINVARIRNELYDAAQALSVAAGRTGDASALADADRVRRMADATGLATDWVQYAYVTTLCHYGWRHCGLTAW